MQMGMNQRIKIAAPCQDCGQTEGHAEDCLGQRLERLLPQRHHMKCPACDRQAVDVNDKDWWECRNCHVQFSSSGLVDAPNPEMVVLQDNKEDKSFVVYQLTKPGQGIFRI